MMPVVALHWKDLDQSNVVGSASYGYVLKINEPQWLLDYSGMTSIKAERLEYKPGCGLKT